MLNKQAGDLKVESAKKEINIKNMKLELDIKDKKLNAMTNLNRTLQNQILSLKSKASYDNKNTKEENNVEEFKNNSEDCG